MRPAIFRSDRGVTMTTSAFTNRTLPRCLRHSNDRTTINRAASPLHSFISAVATKSSRAYVRKEVCKEALNASSAGRAVSASRRRIRVRPDFDRAAARFDAPLLLFRTSRTRQTPNRPPRQNPWLRCSRNPTNKVLVSLNASATTESESACEDGDPATILHRPYH